jgi:hypothetical protein
MFGKDKNQKQGEKGKGKLEALGISLPSLKFSFLIRKGEREKIQGFTCTLDVLSIFLAINENNYEY